MSYEQFPSLIELEPSSDHQPSLQPSIHSQRTSPEKEPTIMDSFGSAAVDIDMLEKEIAAKEETRRDRGELSGNIAGMAATPAPRRTNLQEVDLHAELDTLDEPVWDTVKRDLKTVGQKFAQVIVPRADNSQILKDWDLWGPLFICVALSLILQGHSSADEKAPQFTQVFTITFFGACVVTMNIKLLGGHISFFQSLCVIGYCLLPPTLSALTCVTLLRFSFFLRLALTAAAFFWATYSAMGFLAGSQPEKRRLLIVYPIFLFYFVVSWLIVLHTS
ncbi:hypothetical protein PFISCL1PPCAC_23674 [Pristionchus fissidentatus]|uniref:Protein YIPF n=1 Tax=Pristionchus fissidentatus TaxID=1538716 RepID=A0AAV5WK88_9BILA|nr:hypothetical protein PFISCL1PPCAC_23674 [Pristionchus fissidentatus]